MNWTHLLDNPEPIGRVFGSAPSLQRVSVVELILHRDGPRLMLGFDLADFPSSPPSKWVSLGHNRVHLRLLCLGIHGVRQRGWGPTNVVDIQVLRSASGIQLQTANGDFELEVTFEVFRVDSISAYRDGDT